MKERLITGIGIGIVGIPVLLFSRYIVYPIFLGLLSVIAVWELLRVFGVGKKYAVSIPAYIIAGVFPIFAHDSFISWDKHSDYLLLIAAVMFAYLMYLAAVCVFGKEIGLARAEKDPKHRANIIVFSDVAATFLSVIYVTVSFTAMSLTRYMQNGQYIFALVFVTAWMCDVFAYFTGRLLGKHKLAPNLSPKKTVEGSIGGIVFAIGGCLLYGYVIESVTSLSANYLVLAFLGLALSIVSQIGDIWASLIKREHGIKDYSRMLPGHGGVMDRFDSILAISTILMAICMKFTPFS